MRYLLLVYLLLFLFQALAGPCEDMAFSSDQRPIEPIELRGGTTARADKIERQPTPLVHSKVSLEERIGYSFQNPSLKTQVLTRTFRKRDTKGTLKGERLEFLGDAVLNMLIWETLITRFPDLRKEEKISIHSQLISNKVLAKLAVFLHLHKYITIFFEPVSDSWPKQEQEKHRRKPEQERTHEQKRQILLASRLVKKPLSTKIRVKLLADVLESLVGAVHVDGGLIASKRLIEDFLNLIIKESLIVDGTVGENLLTAIHSPSPANKSILVRDPYKTNILGSLILQMAIIDVLLEYWPEKSPGELTQIKDFLLTSV